MLKSFLKLAFRNLAKRKGYTLMNIAGLAIGITCCLLIFEYVAYERSYDNFNENADRIFRVQDEEYQNGRMVVACASAMPGVAPAMKSEFPEVEEAGRLRKVKFLLANDVRNIRFKEPTVYYADRIHINIFQSRSWTAIQKRLYQVRGRLLFLKKRQGNISEAKILWVKHCRCTHQGIPGRWR